jgi:hypothetical protein
MLPYVIPSIIVMIELIKQTFLGQYEATLAMLKLRVEACPDEYWQIKVGDGRIQQDTYHVLFWTNYYLLEDVSAYIPSEYNERGGDEREPVLCQGLTRADTLAFIEYTHENIIRSLGKETEATLQSAAFPSIFRRKSLTRLELHLYNIRHLQHHMAQMSLVVRKLSDANELGLTLPWVGTGWR